jgi:hypothetical protein
LDDLVFVADSRVVGINVHQYTAKGRILSNQLAHILNGAWRAVNEIPRHTLILKILAKTELLC